jgi:hypothetical protein
LKNKISEFTTCKKGSFYLTLKHLFKKNTMLTDDLNLEDWSVWDNSDSECDYEPGESKLMRLESATLSILQCPNCGSHILSGKLVFITCELQAVARSSIPILYSISLCG